MTKWLPALEPRTRAKYIALADAIEQAVQDGTLRPGDKMPTHRDLADDLGVNVSTVTRGYAEAEQRGLVAGTVGRGTFIKADAATATAMVSFEPSAPGMIEMGLVEPLFRLDPDLAEGFRKLSRRKDTGALMRYTDPRGLPEHREVGAQWAARFGLEVDAGRVVVCSGAQHGLTCALTALLRPGDRLATDSLTYPGLKTLAAMLGIRLTPIAMDKKGMLPHALDAACRREGIKGVYLMPSVHNPTTACMDQRRREQLGELARRHDLTLIEDDAYALTRQEAEPAVASLVPERSVLVAGLSKTIGAGLRVGFLAAPRAFQKPLAEAVLNTVWMTPSLNAELACMWIKDGTADHVARAKREESARRWELARSMLSGHEIRGHDTGFFGWLGLPGGWTGAEFEGAARERGVSVFGAERFAVGQGSVPAMARISLTGPAGMAELEQGLGILAELLATSWESGTREGPR